MPAKKNENARLLTGAYSGTFRTLSQGKLVMTDFDVSLVGDQYKVTKGNKLASGFYDMGTNYQVIFKDQNVWTTEFNPIVILNGNYTYEIKGDSLILNKILKQGDSLELLEYNYFQYRLKKIK